MLSPLPVIDTELRDVVELVLDAHPADPIDPRDVRRDAFLATLRNVVEHVIDPSVALATERYMRSICLPPPSTRFLDEDAPIDVDAYKDSPTVLLANPYGLHQVKGMTFARMTRLAQTHDARFDPCAEARVRAAIAFVSSTNQHTAWHFDDLLSSASKLLAQGVDWARVADARAKQLGHRALAQRVFEALVADGLVYRVDDLHQIGKYYEAETRLARQLVAYARVSYEPSEDAESPASPAALAALDPSQRLAVELGLARKLSIITGAPGTGKTTTIKALIAASGLGDAVVLLAPSHCAKTRLSIASNLAARTVQSFVLSREPLPTASIVVLDECSMVDTATLDRFLRRARDARHIVLVGDPDQLAPIGAGYPFAEIVARDRFPLLAVSRLAVVHRQLEGSPICALAARVAAGDARVDGLGALVRFFDEPREALEALVGEMTPAHTQVLAMNVGDLGDGDRKMLGARHINRHAHARHHRTGVRAWKDLAFEPGDPIIVTKTSQRFFNGQRGIVKRAHARRRNGGRGGDGTDRTLSVLWDPTTRTMDADDVDADEFVVARDGGNDRDPSQIAGAMCELAYAISVHKSQGSEYDEVFVAVVCEQGPMLNRSIVYTALTRAKTSLKVFAQREAWETAVRTPPPRRRTLLSHHLDRALLSEPRTT